MVSPQLRALFGQESKGGNGTARPEHHPNQRQEHLDIRLTA